MASGGRDLASWEDGVIARASARDTALSDHLANLASRPAGADVRRPRAVTDALLAHNDPATQQRLAAYAPFLTAAERASLDRRAQAAGGQPLFQTPSSGAAPDPHPDSDAAADAPQEPTP